MKLTFKKFCESNNLKPTSKAAKTRYDEYIKQSDMFNSDKPETRGGARAGAGRPAPRGETTTMRIPKHYKQAIQELIKHLDESKTVSERTGTIYSESFFMRTLSDYPMKLIFASKPASED